MLHECCEIDINKQKQITDYKKKQD